MSDAASSGRGRDVPEGSDMKYRNTAIRCLAGLAVAYSLLLAGCNTVAGVGEDITGTANAVKRKI